MLLSLQTDAVDVDIDEILDMDNDDIRRSHLAVSDLQLLFNYNTEINQIFTSSHLQGLLSVCKRPQSDISVSNNPPCKRPEEESNLIN